MYCISLIIRQFFFSFLNNPKNLDPSYKMDLDLWDRLGRVKFVLQQNFIGLIELFVVILERRKMLLTTEQIGRSRCIRPPSVALSECTVFKKSGPGCSNLTTSLVTVSLNFQRLISQIHQYFLLKKCEKLLQCKSFSHFFNKKYHCIW